MSQSQGQLKSSLLPEAASPQLVPPTGLPALVPANMITTEASSPSRATILSKQVLRIASLILSLGVLCSISSIVGSSGFVGVFVGVSLGIGGLAAPVALFCCAYKGVKHRNKNLIGCFSSWSMCFAISASVGCVVLVWSFVVFQNIGNTYTTCSLDRYDSCQCCTDYRRLLDDATAKIPTNLTSLNLTSAVRDDPDNQALLNLTAVWDDDFFKAPTPSPWAHDDDFFKTPTPTPWAHDDDIFSSPTPSPWATPTPSPWARDDDIFSPSPSGSSCIYVSDALGSCSVDSFSRLAGSMLTLAIFSFCQIVLLCCGFCKGCALCQQPDVEAQSLPYFVPRGMQDAGSGVMIDHQQQGPVQPVCAQVVPASASTQQAVACEQMNYVTV
jgi:hypothetical protein